MAVFRVRTESLESVVEAVSDLVHVVGEHAGVDVEVIATEACPSSCWMTVTFAPALMARLAAIGRDSRMSSEPDQVAWRASSQEEWARPPIGGGFVVAGSACEAGVTRPRRGHGCPPRQTLSILVWLL